MSTHERKASIREFYGKFFTCLYSLFCCGLVTCYLHWYVFLLWPAVIYPSLLQLQKGVTDTEDKKQKAVCMERYRRRDDDENRQCSDIDIEREEECGICMEMNSKIVLPNCNHAMCLKCYREWYCHLHPLSLILLFLTIQYTISLDCCNCFVKSYLFLIFFWFDALKVE